MRYVDDTSATIWVETADAAVVTVTGGRAGSPRPAPSARTATTTRWWRSPGSSPARTTAYTVDVDGASGSGRRRREGAAFPPSVIATLEPGKPLRMAFGSCRVSVGHDEAGNTPFGVDALRAYALRMAGLTDRAADEDERWPDLVLFLGDQVYADETSEAMQEFIALAGATRRAAGRGAEGLRGVRPPLPARLERPGEPLAALDAAERDDLRRPRHPRRLEHQLVVAPRDGGHRRGGTTGSSAGLASYWVYQHLGNLGPDERAEDALWQRIASYDGDGELDITAALDELADRADQEPESYRWSFARDFDTQARLVVVDSRAARVLEPDAPLDPRRRRDGLARRADARRLRPPADRHLAAVPAGAGAAPRRGVQRGARRRAPGASGRRGSARRPARPPTSSTGRRSRRASGRSPR